MPPNSFSSDPSPSTVRLPAAARGSAALPYKRGPPPTSCEPCRLRRVKCVRAATSNDSDRPPSACQACLMKGLICVPSTTTSQITRNRTGKRIEAAKQIYGSVDDTSPPPSFCSTGELVPSGQAARLAEREISETLGLEFLTLWDGAGGDKAVYAPPVFDFSSLKSRFESFGNRLSLLPEDDQLTARIVFAFASNLPPSKDVPPFPRPLAAQLVANTLSRADVCGIWRDSTVNSVVNCLLLYELIGHGEVATDNAVMILSSAATNLMCIWRKDPQALRSPSRGTCTAVVCHLAMYTTAVAVERRERPVISQQDLDRVFGVYSLVPVALEEVKRAAQNNPFWLARSLTPAITCYIAAGRDFANHVDAEQDELEPRMTFGEIETLWKTAEEILAWGSDVLNLTVKPGELEPCTFVLFQAYVQLSYGPTLFLLLAMLLYLEEKAEHIPSPTLDHYRARLAVHVCNYLRDFRTPSGTNSMAALTSTLWGVSRLVNLAQFFNSTSAWDETLHPGGPGDKLASLTFLYNTLSSVVKLNEPEGDAATATLCQLETERAVLTGLLGSNLDYTSTSELFGPPPDAPSLSQINSWLHLLDVAEPDEVPGLLGRHRPHDSKPPSSSPSSSASSVPERLQLEASTLASNCYGEEASAAPDPSSAFAFSSSSPLPAVSSYPSSTTYAFPATFAASSFVPHALGQLDATPGPAFIAPNALPAGSVLPLPSGYSFPTSPSCIVAAATSVTSPLAPALARPSPYPPPTNSLPSTSVHYLPYPTSSAPPHRKPLSFSPIERGLPSSLPISFLAPSSPVPSSSLAVPSSFLPAATPVPHTLFDASVATKTAPWTVVSGASEGAKETSKAAIPGVETRGTNEWTKHPPG
ncbi:hypothetical protein JCM8547_008532 [Rhodosporidiobolus lusitaniae]